MPWRLPAAGSAPWSPRRLSCERQRPVSGLIMVPPQGLPHRLTEPLSPHVVRPDVIVPPLYLYVAEEFAIWPVYLLASPSPL